MKINYQLSSILLLTCQMLLVACGNRDDVNERSAKVINPDSLSAKSSQNSESQLILPNLKENASWYEALFIAQRLKGSTPFSEVNNKELKCVEDDFHEHVQVNFGQGNQDMTIPDIFINSSSLGAMLNGFGLNCNGEAQEVGLVIHHGLTSEGEYTCVFSLTCMEQLNDTIFNYNTMFNNMLTLKNQELVYSGDNSDLRSWKSNYWERYKRSTRIKPNWNSAFLGYDEGEWGEYLIFLGTRIQQLISNNKDAIANVELAAVSGPEKWEDFEFRERGFGFSHGIALVPRREGINPNRRLLNNTRYSNPNERYTRKALDLGSPCPKYCNQAYFPSAGTPLRGSCN